MLALIYLVLAGVRLGVSKLSPPQRKLVFLYRVGIFVASVALSPFVQMLALAVAGNLHTVGVKQILMLGTLVEVLFVVAIGEHLIFNELQRRSLIPEGSARFPLAL